MSRRRIFLAHEFPPGVPFAMDRELEAFRAALARAIVAAVEAYFDVICPLESARPMRQDARREAMAAVLRELGE